MCSFSTERPTQVPELDLGIAISAGSSKKDETFKLMKDTIKSIMDTHVTSRIHYSLIIFGASSSTLVSFADKSPPTEYLKQLLDRASRESGPPDIKNVLEKSKEIFEGSGLRPNATKILVVMTDKKSSNNPSDLPGVAKHLEENNVRVITVGVGNEVDIDELRNITSIKNDLLKVSSNENPRSLAKQIINQARKGKKLMCKNSFDLINL